MICNQRLLNVKLIYQVWRIGKQSLHIKFVSYKQEKTFSYIIGVKPFIHEKIPRRMEVYWCPSSYVTNSAGKIYLGKFTTYTLIYIIYIYYNNKNLVTFTSKHSINQKVYWHIFAGLKWSLHLHKREISIYSAG